MPIDRETMGVVWPADADALIASQHDLAGARPERWRPGDGPLRVGGCWVCFARGAGGPGAAGDPAWAAAVIMAEGEVVEQQAGTGVTSAAYVPGLLALRVGRLLEQATRRLTALPDVMLLDGTARDHPRRAGLALHLGAVLGVPTVGVTHRPLLAAGDWPDDRRGAASPLRIDAEAVAWWVRTRPGVRPIAVHPGWRVDPETAVDLVLGVSERCRTPEPLRQARRLARQARSDHGRR